MNSQNQISNIKYQKCGVPQGRLLQFYFLLLTFYFFFVAGCNTPNEKKPLLAQIEQLTEQKTQLTSQIEQYKSENEQLQGQIQVLSGVPENFRGHNLSNIREVSIHRYTNIIDDDEDGTKETLIVYVQPIDNNFNKVKAAGAIDVQLWDLDNPEDQALLDQWHFDLQQLQELWIEFLVLNYRLKCDVSDLTDEFNKPLTVRVKFTDYLTGKIFEDQRVIKP